MASRDSERWFSMAAPPRISTAILCAGMRRFIELSEFPGRWSWQSFRICFTPEHGWS